ncbi:hypothetical protein, partial [Falsiroseomonas sp. CW058]|uniref:hypothetical protein n=1 Tax=Falsiroseomonas sp. CW058 TaxID=3388664 RepID=UPI003D320FA4
LGASDPAGARAALADTAAPGLPPALAEERALTEARALARGGSVAEAALRYRDAGAEVAPEFAEFLAAQRDWAGAAAVLGAHLAVALPARPAALDEAQQRLVGRHAALLALAGEDGALAALRQAESPRMAGGAMGDVFALLTAGRLDGVADLPRLRQELEFARVLPSRLDGLREPAPVAR